MRKIQSNLGLHLDLIDASELIFDRIFDRKYFALNAVEYFQRGIQGRGLSASCRTGYENDAIWLVHQTMQCGDVISRKAKLCEVKFNASTIEDAHDDALAKHRRNGRHPKIDINATHDNLDSSVLRHSPFGNIQFGHNLDT